MRSALVASIALFCCGCLGANTTDIAEVPANVELPAPEPEPTPQEKEPAAEEKEPTGEVVQGKRNVAPGNRHPHDIGTRQRGVDWPTFLGPTGDSKSTETGLNTDWRNNRPKIVWRKELGTGYGIGSISRGRYYQFDRFENKATAYCLNAETGAELWTYEYATEYEDLYGYNNGPRCSAVVDDDRVYFYGAGGMLFCLNAYSGDLVWKVDTAKRFGVIQNFFGVGSTPAIDGDLLIVMVGGSPPEAQDIGPGQLDRIDGNGTGIVAFDKMTGEVKYKSSDELASYASMKIATIKGERFGLAFMRGGLVAFHPQTGEQDFHFKWRDKSLESVNASTPVVVGDRVLISETYGPGGALLKVGRGKHEVVWSDEARRREKSTQAHWMTPVHVDGFVYVSSGRHTYSAELRCVEWKTGKVTWTEPDITRSSLLYVDGHLVCLNEYGTLLLLKANPKKLDLVGGLALKDEDGRPSLQFPCWAAPIISHGLMYVRGEGQLVCLEVIPDKDDQKKQSPDEGAAEEGAQEAEEGARGK